MEASPLSHADSSASEPTTESDANTPKEQELEVDLERLRAGDPTYLDELLSTVEPDLIQVACQWAKGNPTSLADLLQEARIRIWWKRASYSGDGSFNGWATKVCLNVCRAHQRLADRHRTVPIDECDEIADDAPGPVECLLRGCREEVVHQALQELSQKERDATVARYLEERTTAEVARKLGLTNRAVRALLDRVLRKLRDSEDVMELLLDEG